MFLKKLKNKFIKNNTISEEYKEEFNNKRILRNMKRGKILSVVLLVMNIFLILVDIFLFSDLWSELEGYKNLFHLHIYFLLIQSLYFLLFYFRSLIKSKDRKLKFSRFINYFLYISVITWCVLLSLNAQLIHQQISAYIICIFCIASIMTLKPWESLLLFGTSFILFFIGLFLIKNISIQLSGSFINLLFVLVLSLSVATLNYYSKLDNFKNQKLIIKKNKELKKHDRLKTVFLGNVSHELKTPLNLIYSAEQMLSYKYQQSIDNNSKGNKSKEQKYIDIIKQNCYRLMRLIDNLLDITKMDTGEYNINLSNNDIVTIIKSIVDSVTEYIESNNLTINIKSKLEEKVIACDPDAVERIVLNLVSNAIKHTPEGGKVEVEIFKEQNMIGFSVSDTGEGVPRELQKTIFSRFKQAGDFFTREREGSGIGLSLVKYLVDMHKGSIFLESKPGKGSKFTIKLPDKKLKNQHDSSPTEKYNNENIVEKIEVEFADIYS